MSAELYLCACCLIPHPRLGANDLPPLRRAAACRQLQSAQTQMERYHLDASDTRASGAAAAGTWGVF